MAPIAEAFVRLRPDAGPRFGQEIEQEVGPQTEKAGRSVGARFGKTFGAGVKVAVGGLAILTGGALVAGGALKRGLIDPASDLAETMSKVTNVFPKQARQIKRWSRDSAQSFGLSSQAALAAVGTFGDMFSQLGFTRKEAANTSEQLVKTAADLGSFHNVDPSDVLQRIGGALRGEYDSLQQLIPNINAARVETEALRQTGKKAASDLTAQEKATAALAIIQKDGANAANDFAETSDGAANKQRILAAQVENLRAKLGKRLLPAYASVLGFVSDKLLPGLENLGGFVGDLFNKVDVSGFITSAQSVVDTATPILAGLAGTVSGALSQVDVSGMISSIAAGVTGSVQPIIDAFTVGVQTGNWEPLGAAIGQAITDAASGAQGIANAVAAWAAAVDWLGVGKTTAHVVVPFAIGLVNEIGSALIDTAIAHPVDVAAFVLALIPLGRLAGLAGRLLSKVPIVGPLLRVLQSAGGVVEGAVVGGILRPALRALERFAPGVVIAARNAMHDLVFVLRSYVDDLLKLGRALMGGLARGIDNGATAVVLGVRLLVRDILRFFRVDMLVNVGGDIVAGLARGIRGAARYVIDAARDLAGSIPGWVKKVLRIGSPSKVLEDQGRWAGLGLAKGLRGIYGSVVAEAKRLGQGILETLNERLDKVQGRLEDMKGAARDVRESVASAVSGSLDIGSLRKGPGALFDVKAIAAKAAAFATALGQLAQRKIAPSLIEQIALAGPEAGLPVAQSFLALGRGQRRELNAAYAQIDQAANRAGRTVANAQGFPQQIAHQQRVEQKLERLIAAVKEKRKATIVVKGDGDAAKAVRSATLAVDY